MFRLERPGFFLAFFFGLLLMPRITFGQSLNYVDIKLLNPNTPIEVKGQLVRLKFSFYNFNGEIDSGSLVCHKRVSQDLTQIFGWILKNRFPLTSVLPSSEFEFSDEKSMEANNTSCFNFRRIKGSKRLSKHSTGLAIDINPRLNPHILRGKVNPHNGSYNPKVNGTLNPKHPLVVLFKSLGWKWGGDWKATNRDYQHFEKPIP